MLKILRVIVIALLAILICLIGTVYSLIRFRHPSNVSVVAHMFSMLHPLVGIKLIKRNHAQFERTAIYLGNHQNNYDMLTISSMVAPRTVTIGKKSLIWVPFFGIVYWLTGNIMINRENRSQAIGTMNLAANIIKQKQISIWMFPEGTRSRGRGLLPFKTGAFHTAIAAGVPIVPVVCSTLHNKIDLNRWHNGVVICEELAPISTEGYGRENLRELVEKCYNTMATRIAELDQECAQLEAESRKP